MSQIIVEVQNYADATTDIQNAINSGADTVIIPFTGSTYNVSPITLVSNQTIVFEPGVLIKAIEGGFLGLNDSVFLGEAISNVTINGYGATISMRKEDYILAPYEQGQWRNCFTFYSCNNLTIEGITAHNSGGDGLYLGDSGFYSYAPNLDVTVKNCIFDGNYRQGLTITSGRNLTVSNCIMRNTSGHSPKSGIDIEPNYEQSILENILIKNCRAYNNEGRGYAIGLHKLTSNSADILITFQNCYSSNNQLGLSVTHNNTSSPGGSINFNNTRISEIDGAAIWSYLYSGNFDINFNGLDIVNSMTASPAWSSMAKNQGSISIGVEDYNAVSNMGQVSFQNTRIYDDNIYPYAVIHSLSGGPITASVNGELLTMVDKQDAIVEIDCSSNITTSFIPPTVTVEVTDYSDATADIQDAINSGSDTIIIPFTGNTYNITPITLVSNQTIILEPGVLIKAKEGEFLDKYACLIKAENVSNINIFGHDATLSMRQEDYISSPYESGEWRHVLRIDDCQDILIEGITLHNSGGDGIYMGFLNTPCSNITIKNCICDGNYRQGISIISGDNILIENCILRNTLGTNPQSGIDIEPNHANTILRDIVVKNCYAIDNEQGYGFLVSTTGLDETSPAISIIFENCYALRNKIGAYVTNNSIGSPLGSVTFKNTHISDSKGCGIRLYLKSCNYNINYEGVDVLNSMLSPSEWYSTWQFQSSMSLGVNAYDINTNKGLVNFNSVRLYDDLEYSYAAIFIIDNQGGTNINGNIYISQDKEENNIVYDSDTSSSLQSSIIPLNEDLEIYIVSPLVKNLKETTIIDGIVLSSINCAKGDIRGLQLIIVNESLDTPSGAIELSVENQINSPQVTLYRENYTEITESTYMKTYPLGFYPDGLIPFVNPQTGETIVDADILAKGYSIPPGENCGYWVDINVPQDLSSGTYTVNILIHINGQLFNTVPIEIVVKNFVLPSEHGFKTKIMEPRSDMAGHYGITSSDIEYETLQNNLRQTCSDLQLYTSLSMSPNNAEGATFEDIWSLSKVSDYEDSAAAYNCNVFTFPMYYANPKAVGEAYYQVDAATMDKRNHYLESLETLISQNPWITTAVIYSDEPSTWEHYDRIWDYSNSMKQYCPSVKMLVTEQTDVTKGNNAELTSAYPEGLKGAVDIWCPLIDLMDETAIQSRIEMGEKAWCYTALTQVSPDYGKCHWHIDGSLVNYFAPMWINYSLGLTGLLYWGGGVYWRGGDNPPINPWYKSESYVRGLKIWNGEGYIAYPSKTVGYDYDITPSLRMMALREGLQDYKLFKYVESLKGRDRTLELMGSVASSYDSFSTDETSYSASRDLLISEVETTLSEEGNIYYVDCNHPDASDSNTGTSLNAPFATIAKSATVAQGGDTIYIREGIYNESLSYGNSVNFPSGTIDNYTQIKAYNNEEVIIRAGKIFTDGWTYDSQYDYYYKTFIEEDGITFPDSAPVTTQFQTVGGIKKAGIENDLNSGYGISGAVNLEDLQSVPESLNGYDLSYVDYPNKTIYLKLVQGTPSDVYIIDYTLSGIFQYSHYVEYDGLTIEYSKDAFKLTYTLDGSTNPNYSAHHVNIKNCEFRYIYSQGLYTGGRQITDCVFEDNYIHHIGRPFKYYNNEWQINNLDHCMYLANIHNSIIRRNKLTTAYGQALHPWNSTANQLDMPSYLEMYDNYAEGFVFAGSNSKLYNNIIVPYTLDLKVGNVPFILSSCDNFEVKDNVIIGINPIMSYNGVSIGNFTFLTNIVIASNLLMEFYGIDLPTAQIDGNIYHGEGNFYLNGTSYNYNDYKALMRNYDCEVNSTNSDIIVSHYQSLLNNEELGNKIKTYIQKRDNYSWNTRLFNSYDNINIQNIYNNCEVSKYYSSNYEKDIYVIGNYNDGQRVIFQENGKWLELKNNKVDEIIVADTSDFDVMTDFLTGVVEMDSNVKMISNTPDNLEPALPSDKFVYTLRNRYKSLPCYSTIDFNFIDYNSIVFYNREYFPSPFELTVALTQSEIDALYEAHGSEQSGFSYISLGILYEEDINKLHSELLESNPTDYFRTELDLGVTKTDGNIQYDTSSNGVKHPIPSSDQDNYRHGTTILLPESYDNSDYYKIFLNLNNFTVREWLIRKSLKQMQNQDTRFLLIEELNIYTKYLFNEGLDELGINSYFYGQSVEDKINTISNYYINMLKDIKSRKYNAVIVCDSIKNNEYDVLNVNNLISDYNSFYIDGLACSEQFFSDDNFVNIEFYNDWVKLLSSLDKTIFFLCYGSLDFDQINNDINNKIWYYINLISEENTYLMLASDKNGSSTDKLFLYKPIGKPISDLVRNGDVYSRDFITGSINCDISSPSISLATTYNSTNEVLNSYFESGMADWTFNQTSGGASTYELISNDNYGQSLKINPNGDTWVAAQQQDINLEPNKEYIFHCRAKCSQWRGLEFGFYDIDYSNKGLASGWMYYHNGKILNEEKWQDIIGVFRTNQSDSLVSTRIYFYGMMNDSSGNITDGSVYLDFINLYPYENILQSNIGSPSIDNPSTEEPIISLEFNESGDINYDNINYLNMGEIKSDEERYYREGTGECSFRIPADKFEVDEEGYPYDDLLLEVGFKNTFNPSVNNIKVYSKLNYYSYDSEGNLDNTFYNEDTQDYYSDKRYINLAYLRADAKYINDADNEWYNALIPIRKTRFQMIRKIDEQIVIMINCLSFNIPISHIVLRKASKEESRKVINYNRYIANYVNDSLGDGIYSDYSNNDCITFIRENEHPIYKFTKPTLAEVGNKIEKYVSIGEVEPINIGVYSSNGIDNLQVTVSDLTTVNGDIIPSSSIDIFNIAFNEDRLGDYGTTRYQLIEDRLETFDSLIVEPNTSQRLWFNISVPNDSIEGEYEGIIQLKYGNNLYKEVIVKLNIYNFPISHKEIIHSVYHSPNVKVFNSNRDSIYNFYSDKKLMPFIYLRRDRQYWYNSGHVFDRLKTDILDRLQGFGIIGGDIKKKVLFDIISVYIPLKTAANWTSSTADLWFNLSKQETLDFFETFFNLLREIENEYNIEFIISVSDEPRYDTFKRILCYKFYTIAQLNNFKTTITYYYPDDIILTAENSDADSNVADFNLPDDLNESVPALTDVVDYKVWAPHQSNAYGEHQSGGYGEFGYYTTYHSNIRFPMYNRFLHGILAYSTESEVVSCYALGYIQCDPFNDIDLTRIRHSDFILAYPTNDGTDDFIPTMSSEGIREGIKDLNLFYKLESIISNSNDSISRQQAQDFLDKVKQNISKDYYSDYFRKEGYQIEQGYYELFLKDISNTLENEVVDYSLFNKIRKRIYQHILDIKESRVRLDSNLTNYFINRKNKEQLLTQKFRYDDNSAEAIDIQIENNEYKITSENGKLIWDKDGDNETVFEQVGDQITITDDDNNQFSIQYKGEGSYLFDIVMYPNIDTDIDKVTKDNFVILYVNGDSSSEELATYYANKHDMDISGYDSGSGYVVKGQMIGLNCSTNEILIDEDTFNSEILIPLRNALTSTLFDDKDICGVVVGYNIPGGFYYDNDNPYEEPHVISTTSRLSRINHSFDFKLKNKLYGRLKYSGYSNDDISFSYICSRIDAPTYSIAKDIIDNGILVSRQLFAGGKMYLDIYSGETGEDAEEYQNDLLYFKNVLVPKLKLNLEETSQSGVNVDETFAFVEDDSFVWSWGTEFSNSNFFQYSNYPRVFFYNADKNSGFTIRNENSNKWPILALKSGYSNCAASMSDTGVDGYLDPTAFYNSLLRGATVGEAYLFSLPYLNHTVALFGDPLVTVAFPGATIEDDNRITDDNMWLLSSEDMARIASYLYKKQEESLELRNLILDSQDSALEVALLPFVSQIVFKNTDSSRIAQLKGIANSLINYPSLRYRYSGLDEFYPDINTFLGENNYRISRLVAQAIGEGDIDDNYLYDEGWWEFKYLIQDDSGSFTNYYFELEISDLDDTSGGVILSLNSETLDGWHYEKEKGEYIPIPIDGIPSNYIGRHVKYQSQKDDLIGLNEYLERGKEYSFRIRQYSYELQGDGTLLKVNYQWREYIDIIWT